MELECFLVEFECFLVELEYFLFEAVYFLLEAVYFLEELLGLKVLNDSLVDLNEMKIERTDVKLVG